MKMLHHLNYYSLLKLVFFIYIYIYYGDIIQAFQEKNVFIVRVIILQYMGPIGLWVPQDKHTDAQKIGVIINLQFSTH